MKEYFLHDGEEQAGPFSLEDLKKRDVNPTDMVWFEGQEEWQEVASIEALSPLFNRATPPPFVKKESSTPPAIGSKNKTERKSSLDPVRSPQPPALPPKRNPGGFIVFLIVAAILIAALVMYLKTKDRDETVSEVINTYEEKVLSIEEQERANPVRFVKASGTFKKMIFGGKYRINGTITNKATVAKYKNVVIQVTFYSGKKAPLGSERHTIEDEFLPGQTKEFKLKLDPPRGTESCRWTAIAATPN